MSASTDYPHNKGYASVIEQFCEFMRADAEYLSWAPKAYWESLIPGVVEYESWF